MTKLLAINLPPANGAHTSTSRVGGKSFPINLGNQVSSRVAINGSLGDFISKTFSAIIIVAGIASFVYMVYGGIQWVTSGGEKDKLAEAKDKITQAIVGLGVVASAWAVFKLVDYFFGIGIAN